MSLIPTTAGDSIVSTQKNVLVYKVADITQPFKKVKNNLDNPSFDTDKLIGAYLGESKKIGDNVWYKVNWKHQYKNIKSWQVPLFLINPLAYAAFPYTTEWLDGWVQGSQVSTKISSVADLEKEAEIKIEQDQENAKLLELVNGTSTEKTTTTTASKGLFGSIFQPTIKEDGTTQTNSNTIYAILGIVVLAIVGLFVFKKKKAPQYVSSSVAAGVPVENRTPRQQQRPQPSKRK